MTDAGHCVQCLCEMGFVPCREKLKWLRSSICPHSYQMRAYALLEQHLVFPENNRLSC